MYFNNTPHGRFCQVFLEFFVIIAIIDVVFSRMQTVIICKVHKDGGAMFPSSATGRREEPLSPATQELPQRGSLCNICGIAPTIASPIGRGARKGGEGDVEKRNARILKLLQTLGFSLGRGSRNAGGEG